MKRTLSSTVPKEKFRNKKIYLRGMTEIRGATINRICYVWIALPKYDLHKTVIIKFKFVWETSKNE